MVAATVISYKNKKYKSTNFYYIEKLWNLFYNLKGATVVVTNQQQQAAPSVVTIVREQGLPPSNYLGFAIFSTLCCCIVFGIVARLIGMA